MADRTAYRDIFLYLPSTGTSFGGFYQAGSITEENLLWMLHNVLLVAEQPLIVMLRASGRQITATSNVVVPGDYDISSEGTLFSPILDSR
jgi:hypothetical protein